MLLAMAGAMSTAELGLSLAEMIRQDKVHAICTPARTSKRTFSILSLTITTSASRIPQSDAMTRNGVARKGAESRHRYVYSRRRGDAAYRAPGAEILEKGRRRESATSRTNSCTSWFVAESIAEPIEIDPKDSWVVAACEKNLPIFTAGLGRFNAGQYLCRQHHSRRDFRFSGRQVRRRTNGGSDRLVSGRIRQTTQWDFFRLAAASPEIFRSASYR